MILQGVPSNLDFTGIPVDLISDPAGQLTGISL